MQDKSDSENEDDHNHHSRKNLKNQAHHQQLMEKQLEEYERLYDAKVTATTKFLKSPAFTSLPASHSPTVLEVNQGN